MKDAEYFCWVNIFLGFSDNSIDRLEKKPDSSVCLFLLCVAIKVEEM